MSDFITLGCPACGGNLQVTKDAERFSCPYCGREHLVRRHSGHVSLVPIGEKLDRISAGVDRHASELAIRRLREDRRKVKDRIAEQKQRVSGWRRTLAEDKAELAGKKTRLVVALVLMVLAGCIGLGMMFVGNVAVCFGLLLLIAGGIFGFIALLAWTGQSGRVARVESSQRTLDKLYRELDRLEEDLGGIDAELDHHEKVVRRS